MAITGKTLIDWGFETGSWFKDGIALAQELEAKGVDENEIFKKVQELVPVEMLLRTSALPFNIFLDPEGQDEIDNLKKVVEHVDVLMRLPTVVAAAVMPDAMPSGSQPGTIPVGGVVSAKDSIFPGMHSADICCSMAITVFNRDDDVKKVLDIAMKTTHFGYGKRSKSEVRQYKELTALLEKFEANAFLKEFIGQAEDHFLTQGDGNHFFYVGEIESSGSMAIVTHHGSRSLGSQLYKAGMAAAKRHTSIVAPRVAEHNAWLSTETKIGQEYWEALQLVREWTKLNHFAIHDLMAKKMGNSIIDRFWNEHNFVFQRTDGLFYHAKGATPSFAGFSPDDDGRTLIPMNMSEPILMAKHADKKEALGFAPHGAGRNFSRSEHTRRLAEEFKVDSRGLSANDKATIVSRETEGLDIRAFSGDIDMSELPSSYKNAAAVQTQIKKYGLTNVYDKVLPRGSIMAGNLAQPWKNKKKAKK